MFQGDALSVLIIVILATKITDGQEDRVLPRWRPFIDGPLVKSPLTAQRNEISKKSPEMDFDGTINRNDNFNDLETNHFKMTERNEIEYSVGISTTMKSPILVTVKRLAKISPKVSKENSEIPKPVRRNASDPCETSSDLSECGNNIDTMSTEANTNSFLPSFFDPLLNYLRGEIWVVPIIVGSAFLTLVMIVFEIYLLAQVVRSSRRHQYPSRRHLFLGQMLMVGLILCCAAAVVYTLKPTRIVCSVSRISIGLAYSLVFSTLLVKLVFLISLNSGVYLPATYQALLLCFAILIQLVIGIQWLVSNPADLVMTSIPRVFSEATQASKAVQNFTEEAEEIVTSCNVTFQQELLGLLYVIFLVIVVVILAFKARGVRENYRESMYIALAMGFTVCIFLVWMLAGLLVPMSYQDVCKSCGLVTSSAIVFIIMFMPKGRQLSAMGKEGVYSEDRTDVYAGTDSSTQSTASDGTRSHIGGTPSPSFFPVQPLMSKDLMLSRERFGTPQSTERLRNLSPTYDHILSTKHLLNDLKLSGETHQQSLANKAFVEGKKSLSQKYHGQSTSKIALPFDTDQALPGWRRESGTSGSSNLSRLNESWKRSHDNPIQEHHCSSSNVFNKHKRDTNLTLFKAVSHRDISGTVNVDSAGEFWNCSSNRIGGGFRSTHDLHAANELRASRNDLRELRDRILARGSSQNDLSYSEEMNKVQVNDQIKKHLGNTSNVSGPYRSHSRISIY